MWILIASLSLLLGAVLGWSLSATRRPRRHRPSAAPGPAAAAAPPERADGRGRLFEAAPDAILILRPDDLVILDANPRAAALYGLPPERLVGRCLADLADDPARERAALGAVLAKGPVEGLETVHRRADGAAMNLVVHAAPYEHRGRPAILAISRDATEARRSELELRASEELNRRILDHLPGGIVQVTSDGAIVQANAVAREFLGLAWQELSGTYVAQFEGSTIREDGSPFPASEYPVSRCLATGLPQPPATIGVQRPDGSCAWGVFSAVPLLDPVTRRTEGAVVTFVDLSERLRAERALRESERRYQVLAEVAPVGIFRTNAAGQCVYCNDRWTQISGLPAGSARGDGWIDALHPDDRERVGREWQRCVDAGAPFRLAYRFRGPDGQVAWVLGQAQPERADDGRIVGYVGTITDITDRKRLEDDLRSSEERYRRLVDNSPIGIAVHQEGRFVYLNDRAVALFGGTSAADLVGTPILDRVHPDFRPMVRNRLVGLAAGRPAEPVCQKIVRLDGRVVEAEVSGTHCVFAGAPAVQIVLVDLGDRRRLEDDLRRAQKMEAVGQLASGIAHDFNNLLTAIFGYTDLAKRTLEPNHPATRSLERVEEAARQASGVTRGLLTFARESPTEKHPVRLERIVEESIRLLRRTLPANIDLRTSLPDRAAWINADPTQIQQVVMNLAINARDAMPDGGTLRIAVASEPGDDARPIRLVVSDTGTGIPAALVGRLFEPFFTTKPAGLGTGLGLAIVHGIVDEHGGSIDVQTEVGRGSTFTIGFPTAGRPAAEPPAADSADAPAGRGELILIADDHHYVRELVSSMLASHGYQVAQAADGEAFLALHERLGSRASLLLIDVDLPRRSGLECLRALRRAGHRIPAILMTGNAHPPAPDSLDDDTTLLVKPFQMTGLAAAVRRALAFPSPAEPAP